MCEMWLCDTCGFGFAQPHVSGDEVFYSLLQEDPSYPSDRWEYAPVRRDLLRTAICGRVLDYGAGDGAFLTCLPDSCQGIAVELSGVLRERLLRRGVETVSAGSLGSAVPAESLDAVTMFQVLEHVADFRSLLSWCLRVLRPGGRLYVSVPEGERLRQWEEATGLPDLPPFHVNQWTRTSLAAALVDAGFSAVATMMDGFSAANAATLLGNAFRAQAVRPTSPAYVAWSVSNRRLRRVLLGALAVRYAPRLAVLAAKAPTLCSRVTLLARAARPEA
jgi:SAM-dependent methyltransferase